MKQFYLEKLTWLMGFVLLTCPLCKAETKVPVLIFSGNGEADYRIELAKLNRITFGENSMVVSFSKDDTEQSIELLYSLYHHLEIGEENASSGIESVNMDADNHIFVNSKVRLLQLQSNPDSEYIVGVFDTKGHLLLSTSLCGGDSVSLEDLASGIYIAVVTDGETKFNLKFILD